MADEKIKQIILHSIDQLWLAHIDAMTHLRDRVALSGYAQKDPVLEYKRESFLMFKKLLFEIRLTTAQNLFRVDFSENSEIENTDYSGVRTNENEISASLENTGEFFLNENSAQKISADNFSKKTVGRNSQCPCGSGKKFKKCCGKNL